jgi:phage FluMu protein Com
MTKCPSCNAELDSATCITDNDAKPEAGDISICPSCGEINQFDNDLNLVILPSSKLKRIKLENPEDYEIIMDAVIMIKSRIKNG